MSVQLILYPQDYNGYQDLGAPQQQSLVADGTQFNSFYSLPLVSLTMSPYQHLHEIPTILGGTLSTNWQLSSYVGVTNPPSRNWNAGLNTWEVRLYGEAGLSSPSIQSMFQKLTGLTIGKTYTCRIYTTQPRPYGQAGMDRVFFNVLQPSFMSPPNYTGLVSPQIMGTDQQGWSQTVSWIAQNTEEFLFLRWTSDSTTDYIGIGAVEVLEAQSNIFSDGQVICDLYNEQEIPITLSVDSFKNAGEKQQSYSKAFNLPATKHNNLIFEHIFDFTRSSSSIPLFNPYKQTKATYKENGIVIFQGFLRLINIQEKKGERSYNVNLYSETTTLATILKTKTFADLSSVLDELNHSFNRTEITQSWYGLLNLTNPLGAGSFAGNQGDTTTEVIRYPFVDWTGQIRATATQGQVGNGAHAGMPSIDRLSDAFRPWINVKYLLKNIFQQAGFTYTSTFLDGSYFSELFMDFNWGADANPTNSGAEGQALFMPTDPAQNFAGLTWTDIYFPSGDSFPASAGYDSTTGIFTAPNNNTTYNLNWDIYTLSNDDGCQFVFKLNYTQGGFAQSAGATVATANAGDQANFAGQFSFTMDAGETAYFSIGIQGNAAHTGNLQSVSRIWGGADILGAVPGSLLNTLRGELGQWDFFKGLVDMFNLVILQDKGNPNNLIIETYNDVFLNNPNSVVHDWTDKVDTNDLKLEPMKLKQTTVFQYAEDKDYPFSVYKNATGGYLYGSLKWTVPQYTLVEGEQKVEAKPFSSTLVKPFFEYHPTFFGPVIYGANDEGTEFQAIDNKPRIMYNVSGNVPYAISGGAPALTYYIPYQNGVSGANYTSYGLFSHTDVVPSTSSDIDLNFGACQFVNGMGVAPTNNLFSQYYMDYFYELYHPDTRTLKLKVLLSEGDVSAFNFYDTVRIKNREFRVDKINYKPKQLSTVELILIP